jgi:hypothetical protein
MHLAGDSTGKGREENLFIIAILLIFRLSKRRKHYNCTRRHQNDLKDPSIAMIKVI